MVWWLIFAVFLYFLCAALIIAEVFVPSGGLISICALACLIGGIAIFFNYSIILGWVGIITAMAMIPTMVIIAYKMFPKTKFGKSVMLTPSQRKKGEGIPDAEQLEDLLGREGLVISPLRPVGMCDFSGRRVECVAESGYVVKDAMVRVIHAEGRKLTVRVIEES